MPRRKRLDHPGAWHHVMNRGAAKADIFSADEDCTLFLDELADMTRRLGLEVHAYSLMPNHFHLLVRSPLGNLAEGMQRVCGRFTQRRNAASGKDGPVFRGRYASQLITNERYLRHVFAYIHLNPVRDRLVKKPDDECWTSHRAYVGLEDPPQWLTMRAMQSELGTPDAIAQWVGDLHRKRQPWPDELDADTGRLTLEPTKRGRKPRVTIHDVSAPKRPAEDVISRVVAITGAAPATLSAVRRGRSANPARRFAALMLARYSTLTHAQIAKRLGGSAGWVAQLSFRHNHALPADLIDWVRQWEAIEARASG